MPFPIHAPGDSITSTDINALGTRLDEYAAGNFTNGQHTHTAAGSGGAIDHVNLANKGTNTHTQIDTAITNSTNHIAAANPHSGSQASSAELSAIAGIAPANDDFIQRKGGVWVKRTVQQVTDDLNIVASGTYASRPAAGKTGRVYLATDKSSIARDNGTTWDEWDASTGTPIVVPNDASFSWENQGAASVTTTNGKVVLTSPTGTVIRGRYVAASNPMTVTARLIHPTTIGGNSEAGLFVGDGTKVVTWAMHTCYGGGKLRTAKWSSDTTWNSDYKNAVPDEVWGNVSFNWARITDNGTNLLFYLSQDGIHWMLFDTQARLNYLASVSRVGWYFCNQTGVNSDYTLMSWSKV